MKIKFALTNRKESKRALPVTRELFYETVRDERVSQVINHLNHATTDEERRRLKGELPAFIFMAQSREDGMRPTKDTAVSTGLCMHDFDHLPTDPRILFNNDVAPMLEAWEVLLAHVTPSGNGLRLVTRMHEEEQPSDCQQRIAEALGWEEYRDVAVKDLSRLSFAVPESYLLYVDDAIFNLEVPSPTGINGIVTYVPETSSQLVELKENAIDVEYEEVKDVVPMPEAEVTENVVMSQGIYRDAIPHTRIVEEVIKRRANEGKLKVGQRNTLLYYTAREMRPVVGSNFNYLYALLSPTFISKGLSDGEIRATIGSALGSGGAYIKSPSPLMQNIINELLVEYGQPAQYKMREMPWLPKPITEILSLVPENLRQPAFLSLLPMLGTLGTGLRFEYTDHRVHSLSFMTHIVAPPASNKSFAGHLYEVVMAKLQEQDDEARSKDEDDRQMRQANQNTAEVMIYRKWPIRLLPARVTSAVLYKRLNDANKMHLMLFTEELSGLMRAMGGQYGGFQETLCKAFDNARDGKETLDDRTPNFNGRVYLNVLTCGTPGVTQKFFNNPEDGMATRFIPIILPDNLADDMPEYQYPSKSQRKRIEQMVDGLMSEKADEKNPYTFPVLNTAIRQWLDVTKQEFMENQDEEWRRFAYRAAVIGFRAAVTMWAVMGKPAMNNPKTASAQRLIDIMLWVADYVRMSQYSLFATRLNEQLEDTTIRERTGKNQKLLTLLTDEFTLGDVMSIATQQGRSVSYDSVCKMASRWCKGGEIVRLNEGVYRKVA